ncbi:MAG TPA: response regulator transcription factor [Chryseolinea sp.]|nr:response regulator transcription factor [Chryseolinea sp.]
MSNKVRILLVDDHTILRDGIAAILNSVAGMEVVGGCSSGEEAINVAMERKPDVILMDIMMGGMTGLEATRWIKEQDSSIKVLIISSEIKKELVSNGIKAGIDGYLPKDVDKATLVEAIHSVMQGKKYFNAAITNLVFEDFYQGESEGRKTVQKISKDLTSRENEILRLVASGKSNQETADILFISVKTVETHKANILGKLGLKNAVELTKYAIKNGIISLE